MENVPDIRIKMIDSFREAAATNISRVHVFRSRNGWIIKKQGAFRVMAIKSTRASALRTASKIKFVQQIIVHERDGTIHVH